MKAVKVSVISLLMALPINAVAVNSPIKGVWQSQKQDGRDARIEITDCASDPSQLCGKIVWLQQPNYPEDDEEAGKVKHDRKNDDPKLQSRPILGLSLLRNFREESPTKFVDGRIYNPDDGQDYTCELTLQDNDHLKVYGYVDVLGIMPVGETQVWKRVSESAKTNENSKETTKSKPEAKGKSNEDTEE
jgi:uncharacterized protein (DUF2147 family)